MRNRALSAASAFSTVVGIAGLLGSAAVLWLLLNGTIYSIPIIGPLFRAFEGLTLYLGVLVVAVSFAHLAVGVLLWKCKRIGGYLGLTLSAFEALSYLSVFIFPSLTLAMVVFLGVGSSLSILLIASWDSLS